MDQTNNKDSKPQSVNTQQLMRIYGALMWSLGKVIQTPEVTRVYIGSFWDKALHTDEYRKLFELEQEDLFEDIRTLPKNGTLRKLNDFIKRARAAMINAYIVSHLAKEMPVFGKEKKKNELIENLPQLFKRLTIELSLSIGDFPDVGQLRERLKMMDFSKFSKLNQKYIHQVKDMLDVEIPKLMDMISHEVTQTEKSHNLKGGIFADKDDTETDVVNPFKKGVETGINLGASSTEWQVFDHLPHEGNKVTGPVARDELIKTKLPTTVLGHIWKLADVDRDGKLTKDEFALCMYLCELKLDGHEIPNELPPHLKPPTM